MLVNRRRSSERWRGGRRGILVVVVAVAVAWSSSDRCSDCSFGGASFHAGSVRFDRSVICLFFKLETKALETVKVQIGGQTTGSYNRTKFR